MSKQKEDKVLVFDLGNVLVKLNDVSSLWQISSENHDAVSSAEQAWNRSQVVKDYESGRIKSFSELYNKLKKEVEISVDYHQFEQAYNQIIGLSYEQTEKMLTALYEQYPLYILSNTSPSHWSFVEKRDRLSRFFKKLYLSFELGVMKPDPMIYRQTIGDIGLLPENIYYFDDRPENVEEAKKHGIHAFQTMGGSPLIKLLKQLEFLSSAF